MTKLQTLGQRIAQARREKGVRERRDVTIAEIAKAVGVTSTSVSEWESDKKTPREDALAKLAKYLGVTPAFLRYGIAPEIKVGGMTITHEHTYTPDEIAEFRRIVAEQDAAGTSARKPRKRGNDR